MIVRITTKNVGTYYTQSDSVDSVSTSIRTSIPLDCWWYSDYGKRYQEKVIFHDEEQVVLVMTESDASPLEDM